MKLEMPVSGVFTSWATPAASRPIDAILSEICSCSSSCARAVTSSTMMTVPLSSRPPPESDCNGTVVMLTSVRASPEARGASGNR